jgi:GTP cyclohydrolase III
MKDYSKEAHLRSIMKAVSYHTLAAVATGSIAYVFTRRLDISLGIASMDMEEIKKRLKELGYINED